MTKKLCIIGGGTNTYISNHLALSAPAYGTTARSLSDKFRDHAENQVEVDLYLTDMCVKGRDNKDPLRTPLDTPEEVELLIDKLIADPDTRVIVFNVAMVDYKPTYLFDLENNSYDALDSIEITSKFGKYAGRLNTTKLPIVNVELTVQDKIINKIRKERKDILLVGFKTTCGSYQLEMFNKGLKLCKDASANIVFVNDVDKNRINNLSNLLKEKENLESILPLQHSISINLSTIEKEIQALQNNGLVTPEESSYWYNTRDEALDALVQMVLDRSHLHFTRSTVVDSETVPWSFGYTSKSIPVESKNSHIPSLPVLIPIPNPIIPESFRTIFNWVRSQGAYKKGPTGNTVGHFGIALGPNEFLTSKRKTDFNKIEEVGLVRVITDDPDNVFGYKHFFEDKYTQVTTQISNLELYLSKLNLWDRGHAEVVDTLKYLKHQLLSLKREDKVIAFGAKPSVGGQSQRSLFDTFPDLDCIIHFHCPLKSQSRELFTTTKQFSYECGSKECIASNLTGFKEYKVSDTHSIWAGHMDYHGPNIVFNSNINPQLVIDFINTHWDLNRKTDGLTTDNI